MNCGDRVQTPAEQLKKTCECLTSAGHRKSRVRLLTDGESISVTSRRNESCMLNVRSALFWNCNEIFVAKCFTDSDRLAMIQLHAAVCFSKADSCSVGQEISCRCGTIMFITASTKSPHSMVSWVSCLQSTHWDPCSLASFLVVFVHLLLGLYTWGSPNNNSVQLPYWRVCQRQRTCDR